MSQLGGRFFAAATLLFSTILMSMPQAMACDVQLGRPNSCNQYCDGDFIDGPEIMSCPQYIWQKAVKQEALEKAKQERRQREEAEQRR